jgi:hypothetical protein
MNFDGTLTKVFRSVDSEVYEEAARKFMKFKGRVYGKIASEEWCFRHGVEIVSESIPEIEPIEVFFLAWRLAENHPVSKEIMDFIEKVGDRIPVSDEERVYLFPKDLHDKILLFGVAPA